MESRWSNADAEAAVSRYRAEGMGRDLALRTYTTRLLGSEPRLVVHGGGNTSVKTTATDITGDEIDVIRVKGSGWDMASIEPPGLPADGVAQPGAVQFLLADVDADDLHPNPLVVADDLPTD
jgi:rhamnose utilization protein RhaD (predicted bifunctional aldolase and dehydrogenase)